MADLLSQLFEGTSVETTPSSGGSSDMSSGGDDLASMLFDGVGEPDFGGDLTPDLGNDFDSLHTSYLEKTTELDTLTKDFEERKKQYDDQIAMFSAQDTISDEEYDSAQEMYKTLNDDLAKINALQEDTNLYIEPLNKLSEEKYFKDIVAGGGQVIGPRNPDNVTAPPEGILKKEDELDPEKLNIRVPFTSKYVSFKTPLSNPIVFGGKRNNAALFVGNMIANLPTDIIQAIPKALVVVKKEAETFGKESESELTPFEQALYGSAKYANVNEDIKKRIENGDGVLSAYIGGVSQKVLDVAFGAQVAAQGFRLLSNLLNTKSNYTKIEAWNALNKPTTPEQATANFNQIVKSLSPDPANPGSANPELYNILTKARNILQKEGIPATMDLFKKDASKYLEWLGRESKLNSSLLRPDFSLKSDSAFAPPPQSKNLIEGPDQQKNIQASIEKTKQATQTVSPELNQPLYHGADAATVQSIKEGGFKGSKLSPGEGLVSLTNNQSVAAGYTNKTGSVLPVSVKTDKVLIFKDNAEFSAALDATKQTSERAAEKALLGANDAIIIKNGDGLGNALVFARPEILSVKTAPPVKASIPPVTLPKNPAVEASILRARESAGMVPKVVTPVEPKKFTPVEKIQTKVQEFKGLEKGYIIDDPNSLIPVGDFAISNRSLKHLVEQRTAQNANVDLLINEIMNVAEKPELIIRNPRREGSTIIGRMIPNDNKALMLVLDENGEIVSSHFKRVKQFEQMKNQMMNSGGTAEPSSFLPKKGNLAASLSALQNSSSGSSTIESIAPSIKSVNGYPQGSKKRFVKPIPGESAQSKLLIARRTMLETEKKFGVKGKNAQRIFSRLSGPRISKNVARSIIFNKVPEKDIRVAFEENLIDGIATGQYRGVSDGLKGVVKPLIKLYEEKGMVGARDVYEEVGHHVFDQLKSDEKRAAFDLALEEMSTLDKFKLKYLDKYKDSDIIEEYIVKKWAKEQADEAGFKGPFQKIFEAMKNVVNKILNVYKTIKTRIETIAQDRGLEGGYINFFDDGKSGKIDDANEELTKSLANEAKKSKTEIAKIKATKEFQKEIKQQSELDRMELSITEEALLADPARQLSRYANKRTGELPEVTGNPTSIFAQKGDDIVTELGFKDSEEARSAYAQYQEKRARYLAAKENISKVTADFREKKQIIEAVTRELRKEGFSRKQKVDAIQDFFKLTDAEMKEVTKKTPDYRLITDKEFENVLAGIEGKAYDAFLKAEARAQLEFTIFDKELVKTDNLRKAMKLPEIPNMSRAQLEKFNQTLEGFKTGDEFLGVRQIETIKNTDLSEIKTKREAIEDLAKRTGVPFDEMQKIKATEFDRYLYDVALARRNPFFKIMVEDTSKALATANVRLYDFKSDLNRLMLKARSARPTGFLDKAIPTDNAIFNFLEADASTKIELAKGMYPEELTAAKFIMDKYAEVRDYLVSKGQLDRSRMNYITHVQRGFLEALKDAVNPRVLGRDSITPTEALGKGIAWKILNPLKELFDQFKQQEANFTIMNQKTGEVLPLEKFFKFAMTRTGELTPSRNVARAVIAYMSAFEKKVALDSIVPKIDVYASSLTPRGMTKRGLELDDSLKRFVKEWLNTKRGRVLNELVKPGGKIDWAIRSGVAMTRILDLGLNVPIGLASNVGEQVMTFVNIGPQRMALGVARSLTPQGRAIAEKYGGLVGEKMIEKIRDTAKDIGDKFSEALFGLFSSAARRANVEHLLGSMTAEEFASGTLSAERIGAIRLEIGKYRNIEQATSVIGATAPGKVFTQYKSWAVPIMHTTLSNLKALADMARAGENFSKTREFYELLRSTLVAAFLAVSTYGLYSHFRDKKDRTFLENVAFKSMNDSLSLFGALDPSLWGASPRLLSFVSDLTLAISNMVTSLTTGDRTGDGEVAGFKKLKTIITPAVARQFLPSDEATLKDEIQDTYEDIKEQAETDKEGALARLAQLKKDYPIVYQKVRQMLVDDKKGITTDEKLIRAMGVANGERARFIFNQVQTLKTPEEKNAYIKNLEGKGIISKDVKTQLKELIKTGDLKEAPEYKANTKTSEHDVITTVSTYAKAIGSDPLTAFNRIFTGQYIRRVDNGAIIVERLPLDESSKIAQEQAQKMNVKRNEMRLDHKVPLELGGSNAESNLWLVPTAEWAKFSPIENYLGKALREKRISKADAQELITQYKDRLIDERYIYNRLEQ